MLKLVKNLQNRYNLYIKSPDSIRNALFLAFLTQKILAKFVKESKELLNL